MRRVVQDASGRTFQEPRGDGGLSQQGWSGDGETWSGPVCALKEESARSLDRWNVGRKINRGVRDDAKAGAPERLELSMDSEYGWSRFRPGRAGEEIS